MAGAKKTIVFFCDGVCQASSVGKIKAGTTLFMVSDGVPVRLSFKNSPFESGAKQINIPVNGVRKEKLGSGTGEFSYTLSCGPSCPKDDDDPSVIII